MIFNLDVFNLNVLFNGVKLFILGFVVDNLYISGILLNVVFDFFVSCLF